MSACGTKIAGGAYSYLEIGSYLGGSLQPHLLDEQCKSIYSIDKRPLRQPDARGFDWTYVNNSTERMLENLRQVDEGQVEKIKTMDGGTDEIDPASIEDRFDLCLIDGEHTDEAMSRDFEFCRKILNPNGGAIMFHDAQITYNGIWERIENLKKEGVPFRAYNLPSVLFVVEIGDLPIYKEPAVMQKLINNHEGYLFSLREMDRFRRFANRAPFRLGRKVVSWLKNGNRSE